jgi:hypothetical protein
MEPAQRAQYKYTILGASVKSSPLLKMTGPDLGVGGKQRGENRQREMKTKTLSVWTTGRPVAQVVLWLPRGKTARHSSQAQSSGRQLCNLVTRESKIPGQIGEELLK